MEKSILENGRPDKPVTCPRCQSLNTKFCYFNNYNVKQPRHFCRECQRYWTAGGSLRNVPVGAGRRKHKSSQANPAKLTGNGNVFCIPDRNLDQGLFIQPIDSNSVLPLKQNVACSPSRKKLPEAQSVAAMENLVHVDATVMKGSEELGFSGMGQKPARELALELKLSEEIHATDEEVYTEKLPPSHVSATHELPPSRHNTKHGLPPSQHIAENDESTCCSSVTATLVSSSSEAVSELNAASTRTPMLSSMANSLGFENPAASWGPLMWPWLWPFSFNGGSAMPPVDPALAAAMGAVAAGGMPQVDPAFAAAIAAVATGNMPRAEPAFAAAIGAVAAGSMPQVDPAFTAAAAASFLQWPHVWNPYAWGLPWNVAWNMTGATSNVSNALSKRPRSPAQGEQGSLCVPKTLRMDRADEAAHSSILSTLNVASLPRSAGSAGFCDAFQPKADVFQPKRMVQQAPEEQSDLQQHQSPHTNPAAQARSVVFQEGN